MKINGLYLQERQPDAVIAGCVEIFENVWPDPYQTIHDIEAQCANPDSGVSWSRAGTIGDGGYQNTRTNMLLDLTYTADMTKNMVIENTNNIFYTAILGLSNSYAKRYEINEPFFHENYQLLKYRSGEQYRAHYDGGTGIARSVSAICYLNNDYEGGEIEFVNFKVKVKPEPGMLILFPSNYAYRHIAHPVVSGTKYAIVTWIRDRQT